MLEMMTTIPLNNQLQFCYRKQDMAAPQLSLLYLVGHLRLTEKSRLKHLQEALTKGVLNWRQYSLLVNGFMNTHVYKAVLCT